MKKFLMAGAAFLVVLVAFVPAADAQQCMKWVAFCDGIQINEISGGQIDAEWYHWDCANNTRMVGAIGLPGGIPNDCPGGNGGAVIACRASDNCPVGDWYFVVDDLQGTIDMNQGPYPSGTCWIDELEYTLTMGVCTGGPGNGPSVSTTQ